MNAPPKSPWSSQELQSLPEANIDIERPMQSPVPVTNNENERPMLSPILEADNEDDGPKPALGDEWVEDLGCNDPTPLFVASPSPRTLAVPWSKHMKLASHNTC